MLARDADRVLAAVAAARHAARQVAWERAGTAAPTYDATAGALMIIDIDTTIVVSHSEKEQASPTFKRAFGFHPLVAFVDHGRGGHRGVAGDAPATRECRVEPEADHIALTRDALKALPKINPSRPGRRVLIRTDGAGCTREFLAWLHARGLSYSIGSPCGP